MATLSVVYPRTAGTSFDYDYYRNQHLPLVGRLWQDAGLVGGEALLGTAAPDGSEAPYFAIGILHFESADALQAALAGEHSAEVIGDIRKFTDAEPVMQVNERAAAPR
ncbi:MAG: EthD family reductase [Bacillota bacterium]